MRAMRRDTSMLMTASPACVWNRDARNLDSRAARLDPALAAPAGREQRPPSTLRRALDVTGEQPRFGELREYHDVPHAMSVVFQRGERALDERHAFAGPPGEGVGVAQRPDD